MTNPVFGLEVWAEAEVTNERLRGLPSGGDHHQAAHSVGNPYGLACGPCNRPQRAVCSCRHRRCPPGAPTAGPPRSGWLPTSR